MEISLRKSKALQTAIKDRIEDAKPRATIIIDQYTTDKEVDAGLQGFLEDEKNTSNLIVALYEVRDKTAIANVECGVSSLLTEVQKIEAQMNLLKSYANSEAYRGHSVINKMISQLAESNSGRASVLRSEEKISVVTSDILEDSEKSFNKCKAYRIELLDEIADKNSKNKITLSEEAVKILRENSLI